MPAPEIEVALRGAVLEVTFNRPAQRNALTWAMYSSLESACEWADTTSEARVLVLRGAGGTFAAGTDIQQFREFRTGDDGVRYEREMERILSRLEAVQVPTVAAVSGYCLGGGLAIAAACDLRVADRTARFGVPIARTLGNCLSVNTCSLLSAQLGPARTLDMLLRARLLDASEAAAAGFVSAVCAEGELDTAVEDVVSELLRHAPLTMWAAKETMRRLRQAALPDGDDIVARVFGSDDFHRAVAAFGSGETVTWTGW
jgi:enoyl-CoA hydratase/carnithine racemase